MAVAASFLLRLLQLEAAGKREGRKNFLLFLLQQIREWRWKGTKICVYASAERTADKTKNKKWWEI